MIEIKQDIIEILLTRYGGMPRANALLDAYKEAGITIDKLPPKALKEASTILAYSDGQQLLNVLAVMALASVPEALLPPEEEPEAEPIAQQPETPHPDDDNLLEAQVRVIDGDAAGRTGIVESFEDRGNVRHYGVHLDAEGGSSDGDFITFRAEQLELIPAE